MARRLGFMLLLVGMVFGTACWGQSWPFGASDETYGLRSRADTNPGFQYTPSPTDWRDVNIYQLFTDRFADSGEDQLSGYKDSWKCEPVSFPNNRNFHHGGDWKGLKNNLDYLSGMGVKAIWMSGVQMNDQGKDGRYTPYHMYHPTDFFRVDRAMGTFQDLKDLIDACHARGIYVILDVVINHTADKNGLKNGSDDQYYHPGGGYNFGWWNDGNKHGAPFDDLQYFHNNGTINNWDSYPEYIYGQFKGTDDLKTENSQVQGWLDQAFKNLIDATDCDGFRVDAIKHVEYDWIRGWADSIRKHAAWRGKNDFIMFGEYFTYNNGILSSYCKDEGYSFNSALFFPLSQTIKSVFADYSGTANLWNSLNEMNQYGEGKNRLVSFIDNHDVNRIGLQMGANYDNIVYKMRPALTFLYTMTPVPCLYYGTEHAFQQGGHYNGSNKTEDNPDDGDWQRECMFDKGFQPGPASGNKLAATDAPLYLHIKALNEARSKYPSLTRGSMDKRWDSGGSGGFAMLRKYGDEEALIAFNTSDGSVSINPTVDKANGTEFFNALNPTETVSVSGGQLSFSLNAKESKIFIAGAINQDLWVGGTYNWPADGDATSEDTIWVNTKAGPTSKVVSVTLGYSSNGGTNWSTKAMSVNPEWTAENGRWYNTSIGPFSAGSDVRYYIAVADAETNQVWDNNDSQNFRVAVAAGPGVWIRNTANWPASGVASELDDLWVNTEAGPSSTVKGVKVKYSTDNGTNWSSITMSTNTGWTSEGGMWFNANLGSFDGGSVVKYYIEATDGSMTNVDNNAGAHYAVAVNALSDNLWAGNVGQVPGNGAISDVTAIQIGCETWPIGIATGVQLCYSTNGTTWTTNAMTKTGQGNNNDLWKANIGPFANGQRAQYYVLAQSSTKTAQDNNNGLNYEAIVALRMVQHTPTINAPGNPDNPGDAFDFDTTGGAAMTSGSAGFGSFGRIYVNCDATNLYIGGTEVALPTDSANNAYVVFVSGGTNTGSDNLWGFDVDPQGLDQLHNAAFQPPVNFAILLGDVWGDGTFFNFNMYKDGGIDFGQGVFATRDGTDAFMAVDGARLSQFGGYGTNDRLAANWECAIPLAAFGVTNAAALTNLYLSGLMVTGDTTNNNRFISGKYLGASAELGNSEQPDEWGNFAYSFVNLAGLRVYPPRDATESFGVPNSWIAENLPQGHTFTENSNYDGDTRSDRYEYFLGTDPQEEDLFIINELELNAALGYTQLRINKFGDHLCYYMLEVADQLTDGHWNWTNYGTLSSSNGVVNLPYFTATNMLMRIKVAIPE